LNTWRIFLILYRIDDTAIQLITVFISTGREQDIANFLTY
jgi:hypothetical protein